MGVFIVEGGARLAGTVKVSGSKNAALPVLFATISVKGISRIDELPRIEDVRVALQILRSLGARIETSGNSTYIDTRVLKNTFPDNELTSRLRASTYLIGGMLARFGRVGLPRVGGCNFSARPIDMHLAAAEAFGAKIEGDEIASDGLIGANIDFSKISVGATVNSLIMAASAEGESLITGASQEPHIDTLIAFLNSAGASVSRVGSTVFVRGTNLSDGRVQIPGDMIEAGTYLALSAMNGGRIKVCGASPAELSAFISPLLGAGASVKASEEGYAIGCPPKRRVDITTAPFPGFPTDLQPILPPLLALGGGGSITDNVWCERFGYLQCLEKMGIKHLLVGNRAEIFPSRIVPADVSAPDLRGGAASLIAALCANGKSRIFSAETVLRGYESPKSKLEALGAKIKYVAN